MFKDISGPFFFFPCTLKVYHLYLELNNLDYLSFCIYFLPGYYIPIDIRMTMRLTWRNNINQEQYKIQKGMKSYLPSRLDFSSFSGHPSYRQASFEKKL